MSAWAVPIAWVAVVFAGAALAGLIDARWPR
jgi:hypothetical protein